MSRSPGPSGLAGAEVGAGTTIAAVATATGRAATALVRVSGPSARALLARISPSLPAALPARVPVLAAIRHPDTGALIDRALVTFFQGPGSYTGEDVVEVSCHGGTLTPVLVLEAFHAAGALPADPGQFTRRALMNGKLDLLQAEAILDVIDATSPALHKAAIFHVEKGLTRRIEAVRAAVLKAEGLVAYSIDFPEEDEPPSPPERIRAAAEGAHAAISRLLDTAPRGEMLRQGALVVLAGRPNSGKSSLFNALLGVERAIVTSVPGTTRDAVEATLLIEGYPFRLVDTAGLRESRDLIEGMGIEVARRYLSAADLVLFCVAGNRELADDELGFLDQAEQRPLLLVRTRADETEAGVAALSGATGGMPVSSHTGEGLGALRDALLRMAFRPEGEEPPEIITRERHARALRVARDEIEGFLDAFAAEVPPEFSATHLRAAAQVLEELIGAVTPDDVLGEVFGQFCVGK